jgi:N-acyl-D-amino-acid deacylase
MDTMLVDRARERGAQVYFDHYPYETFDGGASAMFPGWALRGGAEGLQGVLADPAEHAKLQMDLDHVVDIYGGADRLIITSHVDASLVGKSVGQVARERGKTPNETLIDFALAGNERLRAGHLARNMGMSEYDNDQYIRQDYTATSTDGGVTTQVGGPPGRHPRYWGAFPRKISRYVKERGVITLPFAIRSMTSLGAQIIGLPDRGEIREGYKADITIFSFPEITDRATIMEPGLPSEGIYYVTVNGKLLMDNKQLTGELAGRVLNRNEVKKSVRISR